MFKKAIIFILLLLPWFLVSIIPVDYNYYSMIKLPFFAPPKIFYGIAWTIVYTLITITTSSIINSYKFKDIPLSYKITLLVNYLNKKSTKFLIPYVLLSLFATILSLTIYVMNLY